MTEHPPLSPQPTPKKTGAPSYAERGVKDGRSKRTRRYKPWQKGRQRGVWYPELVGVVRGYPKTQEEFVARQERMRVRVRQLNAAGLMGRRGVPDGAAGLKPQFDKLRDKYAAQAKKVVQKMIDAGVVPTDDATAIEALEFALATMRDKKTVSRKDALAAAALVLRYTKSPPPTKAEVALTKAEDFLAALADPKKE